MMTIGLRSGIEDPAGKTLAGCDHRAAQDQRDPLGTAPRVRLAFRAKRGADLTSAANSLEECSARLRCLTTPR